MKLLTPCCNAVIGFFYTEENLPCVYGMYCTKCDNEWDDDGDLL